MKFEKTDSGFIFSQNNRIVIEHSEKKPLFFAGTGTQKVKSRSGFFSIAERNLKLQGLCEFKIISEDENKVNISFSKGEASIDVFFLLYEKSLEIKINTKTDHLNRLKIQLPALIGEQIFGCGEQYIGRSLRGKKVPLWVSEPGVGRRFDLLTLMVAKATKHFPRWFNTYYPAPQWISLSGLWFKSSSFAYTVFDFRQKSNYTAYFWDVPQKIELGLEKDMPSALSSLSEAAGRQPKLPEWAYDGLWLGTQGGTNRVTEVLNKLKENNVKVSALWCQDWEGRRQTSFGKQLRWAWEYDKKLYPELPKFIKKLNTEGIRFLGYNNTFLTPGSTMFDEAVEKQYLVKKADGSPCMVDVPFDPAAMVDFTNPEAKKWLKEIIKKNMIEIGMSGWMADFGEMIQHDSSLYNGNTGLDYHNKYPVDWAQVNREAVEESGKKDDIIYFMRAGYGGASLSTPLNWTGDQLVDWSKQDGLPSAIAASISLGLSGIGYVHSDIGGYTTIAYKKRSKELLMRWAEFAAFTQVMRSHEGNRPDDNFQFGSDDLADKHLARMTAVYSMLKPYHIRLSKEYIKTGLPPIRHILLHYPEAKEAIKNNYTYLYGEDLLVAPVIKPGRDKWTVNLPGSNWIHLWSGKGYSGKHKVTVDVPLGNPPVFYKEGAEMTELFKKIGEI